VTGDEGKMQACTEALRAYGILEIAGSGSVALSRAGFRNGEDARDDKREMENFGMGILMAEGERLSCDAV
jgi:acetolactate synthase-1/3 small subunit